MKVLPIKQVTYNELKNTMIYLEIKMNEVRVIAGVVR